MDLPCDAYNMADRQTAEIFVRRFFVGSTCHIRSMSIMVQWN